MVEANLYQPWVVDFESKVMRSQDITDGAVRKTMKTLQENLPSIQDFGSGLDYRAKRNTFLTIDTR